LSIFHFEKIGEKCAQEILEKNGNIFLEKAYFNSENAFFLRYAHVIPVKNIKK
jgi:uncharacterized protein YkuJ